jgi:SOS-response transcriptional repressor LexA
MKSEPLTPRQQDILDYVRDYQRDRGKPPTVREIGHRFDIRSPNGVYCHIKALEKKGYIQMDAGESRGIRVVGKHKLISPPVSVPAEVVDLAVSVSADMKLRALEGAAVVAVKIADLEPILEWIASMARRLGNVAPAKENQANG